MRSNLHEQARRSTERRLNAPVCLCTQDSIDDALFMSARDVEDARLEEEATAARRALAAGESTAAEREVGLQGGLRLCINGCSGAAFASSSSGSAFVLPCPHLLDPCQCLPLPGRKHLPTSLHTQCFCPRPRSLPALNNRNRTQGPTTRPPCSLQHSLFAPLRPNPLPLLPSPPLPIPPQDRYAGILQAMDSLGTRGSCGASDDEGQAVSPEAARLATAGSVDNEVWWRAGCGQTGFLHGWPRALLWQSWSDACCGAWLAPLEPTDSPTPASPPSASHCVGQRFVPTVASLHAAPPCMPCPAHNNRCQSSFLGLHRRKRPRSTRCDTQWTSLGRGRRRRNSSWRATGG